MNTVHSAVFDTIKASGPSRADAVARITLVANLMDSAFFIPGLNRRIGLDSVIGLVPGVGDTISAVVSSYIIWEARQLGLPRWKIARMMGNVAIDTAVGIIPVAGDLFDVYFKANMRNLRIIQDHLGLPKHGPREIDGTAVRVGER